MLPRQSLGSPNSRWSCPSSFPAPWKWIFTLFHSLRKQQMRGMGLNLNPIVAGNEAEINQDYSIPAGLTWSIQNLPVPLPGASRAQGAVSRPQIKSKFICSASLCLHFAEKWICASSLLGKALKAAESAASRLIPGSCTGSDPHPQG